MNRIFKGASAPYEQRRVTAEGCGTGANPVEIPEEKLRHEGEGGDLGPGPVKPVGHSQPAPSGQQEQARDGSALLNHGAS